LVLDPETGYCPEKVNFMNSELFVIRTADGLYVGSAGLVPTLELATHFPSRMAALGKCTELGAVIDHAAIMPYRPQGEAPGSGWGKPSPQDQERLDAPAKGRD
jgi:hypothetical protein